MYTVFERTRQNQKLLFKACQDGHLEVIKALIQDGVDVNQKNKFNLTPLHIAAQKGHKKIVKS